MSCWAAVHKCGVSFTLSNNWLHSWYINYTNFWSFNCAAAIFPQSDPAESCFTRIINSQLVNEVTLGLEICYRARMSKLYNLICKSQNVPISIVWKSKLHKSIAANKFVLHVHNYVILYQLAMICKFAFFFLYLCTLSLFQKWLVFYNHIIF